MPLLTSPIDGSPMRQINRYGIEIDVCPTSGGVWLDKGELEKVMAILKEEATNAHPASYRQNKNIPVSQQHYSDDDDYAHHKNHKGKRKMSRMLDIFDF